MVEDFGSYLKHERELRGVPLEEISGATKIHIRYLKALEKNSFDELPGEVFVKGYIRSYATAIGSDAEEVLNIYRESVEQSKQENTAKKAPSFEKKPPKVLISILIVSIFVVVGFLIKNSMDDSAGKVGTENLNSVPSEKSETSKISNSDLSEKVSVEETMVERRTAKAIQPETSAEKPSNQNDPVDQTEEIVKKEAESEIVKNQVVYQNKTIKDLKSNPNSQTGSEKPLKLSIRAKETSWFNLTIDSFREEDFILPTDDEITFSGNETFKLTIGNKTGVELFLNGEELKMPASEDKVIKDFIITSKLAE